MRRALALLILALAVSAALAGGFARVRVVNIGRTPLELDDGSVVPPGGASLVDVPAGHGGTLFGQTYPALSDGAIYTLRAMLEESSPQLESPDSRQVQPTRSQSNGPNPETPRPQKTAVTPMGQPPSQSPAVTPMEQQPSPSSAVVPMGQPSTPPPAESRRQTAETLNAAPPDGMVLVPAGVNEGVDPDFGPYSLRAPGFFMDKTEVTLAQWRRVHDWAIAHGYRFDNEGEGRGGNHPVHTVSWYDCAKWCNARSEMEGLEPVYWRGGEPFRDDIPLTDGCDVVSDFAKNGYRLPGRAYWEYAARGGLKSRRFPWGDSISWDEANYRATTPGEALGMVKIQADISPGGSFTSALKTEPPSNYDRNVIGNVGANIKEDIENYLAKMRKGLDGLYDDLPHLTILHNAAYYAKFGVLTAPADAFAPNGYGLYNMVGNVAEWLQSPDYAGAPAQYGAYFGGGWNSISAWCRFGMVTLKKWGEASPNVGFRTILPSGALLGDGSGPVSFSPSPPVFHYNAKPRAEVRNFQMVPPHGLVLVPIFTDCGFEMRQPDPRFMRTYGDAFAEAFAKSAEMTEVVEESIPEFPASGQETTPQAMRSPAKSQKPDDHVQTTPQSSKHISEVPIFHVNRVPHDQADLVLVLHEGDATATTMRDFSFGRITFTLENRTKYRIVKCVMKVAYRAGMGHDVSFTDIEPGGMQDADSPFMLVGSHAADDLKGNPFIFPALVLCVGDDGKVFDLYERDGNLSVGFLRL